MGKFVGEKWSTGPQQKYTVILATWTNISHIFFKLLKKP